MIEKTLFSQILSLINRNLFKNLVRKHKSDFHSKSIDTWTLLVSRLFMQMADGGSLRDTSNGLRSITSNMNHLGGIRLHVNPA